MSSLGKKRKKKRQVTFLDTKKEVTKRDKVFSNQLLRIKQTPIPWDIMKLQSRMIESSWKKSKLKSEHCFGNSDPISKPLRLIDNEVEKNTSHGFTPLYLIFVSSLPERTYVESALNRTQNTRCILRVWYTSLRITQAFSCNNRLFFKKNNQFYEQRYPLYDPLVLENAQTTGHLSVLRRGNVLSRWNMIMIFMI